MNDLITVSYIKTKDTEIGFSVEGVFPFWEDIIRDYLCENDVIGPNAFLSPSGVYPYIPYGSYVISLHWNSFANNCFMKHNCFNDKQAYLILLKVLNVKMEDDATC
jgi:hypothetical protein